MLAAFSNMETVHIAAYALLLETIGMPDSEFSAFMEYEEMAAKHDYLGKFGVEHRTRYPDVHGGVWWLHRRAAIICIIRYVDELPTLQQDEGDGADCVLVGAG